MIGTTIQINGLKEVREMMAKLPDELEISKDKIGNELANNLQRRIRNRAPVDTGWLKQSVMVEKDGKKRIVSINAFYAMAVEKGSYPRFIPIDFIKQHKQIPNAPGVPVYPAGGWVYISGRAKPFIEPAIASFRQDIPNIVSREINKAIKKSGGK